MTCKQDEVVVTETWDCLEEIHWQRTSGDVPEKWDPSPLRKGCGQHSMPLELLLKREGRKSLPWGTCTRGCPYFMGRLGDDQAWRLCNTSGESAVKLGRTLLGNSVYKPKCHKAEHCLMCKAFSRTWRNLRSGCHGAVLCCTVRLHAFELHVGSAILSKWIRTQGLSLKLNYMEEEGRKELLWQCLTWGH